MTEPTCRTITIPKEVHRDCKRTPKHLLPVCDFIVRNGGVWGDLVRFEEDDDYEYNYTHVFDGQRLIEMNSEMCLSYIVPYSFTPLEKGLPLKYWASVQEEKVVWVSSGTIRDGLVSGPQWGIVPGRDTEACYIIFSSGGKHYTVVVEDNRYDRMTRQQHIDVLEGILLEGDNEVEMYEIGKGITGVEYNEDTLVFTSSL